LVNKVPVASETEHQDMGPSILDGSPTTAGLEPRSTREMDRRAPIVTRMRFQLIGGLFVAMILPLPFRFDLIGSDDPDFFTTHIQNTFLATIIGYYGLKRLMLFPGINGVSYVLPVFTTSFLGVIAWFFFARLDYGRFQFMAGYLMAIAWFSSVFFLSQRASLQKLALIPIGETLSIRELKGAQWSLVETPTAVPDNCSGVVADLRADHPPQWQRFIAECVLAGTPVFHVKQIRESLTGRLEIEHLSENTLGSLNPNDAYLKLKRLIDTAAAVAVTLILAPFLLLIGLLIRADSRGPALFKQQRMGRGGEIFTMYKFRTMVVEEAVRDAREAAITRDGDARITRPGRFLRRSRIDELPQIINILKGEMSWIGPRPEAVPLSKWYEDQLPFYRYRHIVRPGITGWAQVNQGHVAEPDQVLEKLHYDFFYIKNFSPWLDILVVLKTLRTMLTGFGAR
jgi:lipopolysaccharide/colanic/teichoic acid biosynthesis glycosyltransferase